jgi:diguanylate cyclase (GGDEF)-like protein
VTEVMECSGGSELRSATKKVVLVESEKAPLTMVREALKDAAYDIATCKGGFDALDELTSEGADILIAGTQLSDLSGYQLSCLLKSTERTSRLPVLLVNTDGDGGTFWPMAAQADLMIDLKDLKAETLAEAIKELIDKSREMGWMPALVKNAGVIPGEFSSSDLVSSYQQLSSELLCDRMVSKMVRVLSGVVEPRNRFLEYYFTGISQLFNCSLYGFVLAGANNPWASFQVAPGSSTKSFNEVVNKVKKQLELKELSIDVRGKLDENGKAIPTPEILPVQGEKGSMGALIFAAGSKKGFDETSRRAMALLQVQMQPVLRLLQALQEIQTLSQKEQYRASTDTLTGLYNLEFLVGFLQQQLLFSYRQRSPVGLAIIDVDNFQAINDEYGHEMGDLVLSTMSNRMLNLIRGSDLIARYGGDEFAVVLPNTDITGTKTLGEKLRTEIQQLNFVKGSGRKGPRVTVSVGCSCFNMEDLNPETILRDAKHALARAKEGGRNQVSS